MLNIVSLLIFQSFRDKVCNNINCPSVTKTAICLSVRDTGHIIIWRDGLKTFTFWNGELTDDVFSVGEFKRIRPTVICHDIVLYNEGVKLLEVFVGNIHRHTVTKFPIVPDHVPQPHLIISRT